MKLIPCMVLAAAVLSGCGGGDSNDAADRVGINYPGIRIANYLNEDGYYRSQRGDLKDADGIPVAKTGFSDIARLKSNVAQFTATYTLPTGTATFQTPSFSATDGHRYIIAAYPRTTGPIFSVIDDPYDRSLSDTRAFFRVLNGSTRPMRACLSDTMTDDPCAYAQLRGDLAVESAWPASGRNGIGLNEGPVRLRVVDPATSATLLQTDQISGKKADDVIIMLDWDAAQSKVTLKTINARNERVSLQ
ncbi:hypothetical protein [Burkholderia cenocepacia]|uniref:hypothetical protein n=1 Tax=Burkholderia cenocepacia TaxID=95486 RepID=UPI00285BE81B|nr:hypothetical protein [Burkholderia cenocepacia]MDR8050304.1 hypothetical protein [Burkholderia cenocepacia]